MSVYMVLGVIAAGLLVFVLFRARGGGDVTDRAVVEDFVEDMHPQPALRMDSDSRWHAVAHQALERIYAPDAASIRRMWAQVGPGDAALASIRKVLKAFDRIGTLHASLAALDKPGISLKEIGDMVTRDPVLSALVLKTVNSPLFRGASDVKSIHTAVNILGLTNLKNLIAYGVMPYAVYRTAAHRRMFKQVWLHMNATAVAASCLAKALPDMDSGFLYTTGLMHDIGKLVLILMLPAEGNAEYPLNSDEELHLVQATHLHVLQLMADNTGMPAQLRFALLHHHHPTWTPVGELDCNAAQARVLVVLFLANQIAKLIPEQGDFEDGAAVVDALHPSFSEILSCDEARQLVLSPGLLDDIVQGVRVAQAMLA